ncbi:ImmA/IrrE family metallo-endopeptidase [Eubacteriales bacterium SGI.150]
MLASAEAIHRKAVGIVKQCDTRDMEKIAQALGIYLHYNNEFTELLGMYVYHHKERHIILNSHMEDMVSKMVCAYEIGHDCLHRGGARKSCLQEFVLFDMRNSMEYEANAFASHLLVDDDELAGLLEQGYDVVQIASAMETNVNLVLIKLNELNRMGWHFDLPYVPRSDFLRRIKTTGYPTEQ